MLLTIMAMGRFPTAASERVSSPVSLFMCEVSGRVVAWVVVISVVVSPFPELSEGKSIRAAAIATTRITAATDDKITIRFFIIITPVENSICFECQKQKGSF